MKASLISCCSALCLCVSLAANADCAFPKAPDAIPDGKTASEQEMLGAMSVFKTYNGEVDSYLVCLDAETATKIKDAGGVSAIMQIKAIQQKKRGSAEDERQAKVVTFNEQVRAFKARKS